MTLHALSFGVILIPGGKSGTQCLGVAGTLTRFIV